MTQVISGPLESYWRDDGGAMLLYTATTQRISIGNRTTGPCAGTVLFETFDERPVHIEAHSGDTFIGVELYYTGDDNDGFSHNQWALHFFTADAPGLVFVPGFTNDARGLPPDPDQQRWVIKTVPVGAPEDNDSVGWGPGGMAHILYVIDESPIGGVWNGRLYFTGGSTDTQVGPPCELAYQPLDYVIRVWMLWHPDVAEEIPPPARPPVSAGTTPGAGIVRHYPRRRALSRTSGA